MDTVGAFEAKTNLSALLGRVEQGEIIVITRHGKPIARLVPDSSDHPSMSVGDCIAGLLEFRETHPMRQSELRGFIDEGRKY